MIKNIAFDLGNVLIGFRPQKFTRENVEEKYQDKFFEIVFRGQEWKDLDRGTLTYEEAIKIFTEKLPECEKPIRKLFDENIYDCLEPIEKNIALLPKLKENYNLYIISNFHLKAFENIYEKWDFFKLFDGKVISAYHKLMKPEAEIYQLLLDTYSLKANECLFIDDVEENIIGAKNMGMNGIQLTDYNFLKEKLKEYGIKL